MNNILKMVLLLMQIGIIAPVSATVVQGSFEGVIVSSVDYSGTFGATGTGLQNGAMINGQFSYDTTLAPADLDSATNSAQYQDFAGNDWLQMSMSINGTTFGFLGDSPQVVNIYDTLNTTGYDGFEVSAQGEVNTVISSTATRYTGDAGNLAIFSYVNDFINGEGLEQNFTWTSSPGDYESWGHYSLWDYTYDSITATSIYHGDTIAGSFLISSISIRPTPALPH